MKTTKFTNMSVEPLEISIFKPNTAPEFNIGDRYTIQGGGVLEIKGLISHGVDAKRAKDLRIDSCSEAWMESII